MVRPVDLTCSISAFTVSFVVGITGVGGSSSMTPLLTLFGVHPATAVGTETLCGSDEGRRMLVHSVHKTIDWSVVRRLAAGSTPAAGFTLVILSHFNVNS
jgi:uncharacterized membrane protein YfcA